MSELLNQEITLNNNKLIWIVTETYYKHGEYTVKVFSDENELSDYLDKEIKYYHGIF